MSDDPKRAIILYILAAILALLALIAALAYVKKADAATEGCTSAVRVGEEPVTMCDRLWLPVVWQGAVRRGRCWRCG